MNYKLVFKLRQIARKLSVRAGFSVVFAIAIALLAVVFAPYVPENFSKVMGGKAVDSILTIIASSMLAVVTFSLSVMVNSYATAAGAATPRATKLLVEDTQAQNALSIFLGAFIYSIVGLVALSTGYYGPPGRVILFITTIIMLLMIVWTMVKWIDHLSTLGRVGETIQRLEKVAINAFCEPGRRPKLQCKSFDGLLRQMIVVYAKRTGFIQTIDLEELSSLFKDSPSQLYIEAGVGTFVHTHSPIAYIDEGSTPMNEKMFEKIRAAFLIGDQRTFDDDPQYSLVVLSEIALKALSSAINDPGTANDVIVTIVRIITKWQNGKDQPIEACKYQNVFERPMNVTEVLNSIFDPIAREGAAYCEVAIRLQTAFAALATLGDNELSDASYRLAIRSLKRSELAMSIVDDLNEVKRQHRILFLDRS